MASAVPQKQALASPDGAGQHTPNAGGSRVSHVGTLVLLYVACLAIGAILLFRPRPVPPRVAPRLVLSVHSIPSDPGHLSRLLSSDAIKDAAENVRNQFAEASLAEAQALDGSLTEDRRGVQVRAQEAVEALGEVGGDETVALIRESMAHELTEAVMHRGQFDPPDNDEARLLGGFLNHLRRYGLIRGGQLYAPQPAVRALAKARWNAMAGQPLQEDFTPVETEAYWGWLAFHAEGAEAERRLRALNSYEESGKRAPILRAILVSRLGQSDAAASLFQQSHAKHYHVRFHNHALALQSSVPAPGEGMVPQ